MSPRKPYKNMTPDELEATREYMRKKKLEQRQRDSAKGKKQKQYSTYEDRKAYFKAYYEKKKSTQNIPETSD